MITTSRCDSFNTFFYFLKKVWHIVKVNVYNAMGSFFEITKLYEPINITDITLIPKMINAFLEKQFRLISYYIIVYKLISKVLTRRL